MLTQNNTSTTTLQERASAIIEGFNGHDLTPSKIKDTLLRIMLTSHDKNCLFNGKDDIYIMYELHELIIRIEEWHNQKPNGNLIKTELRKQGIEPNNINELFLFITNALDKKKNFIGSKYERTLLDLWELLSFYRDTRY